VLQITAGREFCAGQKRVHKLLESSTRSAERGVLATNALRGKTVERVYRWTNRLISGDATSKELAITKPHLQWVPLTETSGGRVAQGTTEFMYFFLKVCKCVHHCTIQINHQPDATIFQFIILTSIYSSTCFGRFPAHHQEFNDCSSSLWFFFRIVVTVVLCSWSGRPDHEHSTTVTTIRRQYQRLLLQSLNSWWWARKCPKHVEL